MINYIHVFTLSVAFLSAIPAMYQDNVAGGLDPNVIQFISYFRSALNGECSLLRIDTLNGFTETNKKIYMDASQLKAIIKKRENTQNHKK